MACCRAFWARTRFEDPSTWFMGMIFFSLADFMSSFYKKAPKYCSRKNIVFFLLCRGDLYRLVRNFWNSTAQIMFSHLMEERILISHHLDI